MPLHAQEVHIWSIDLTETYDEKCALALLNTHEIERANQFHFPIHRERFIRTHAALRQILSTYIHQSPESIVFHYTPHNKPYLAHHPLQFNVSHSHDISILALQLHHPIGIDIEKIKPHFEAAVAKRYFSKNEYKALLSLSNDEKASAFYHIWSRKEALVKGIGKGLSIPLASFSVSHHQDREQLLFESQSWTIISLSTHPQYAAALATLAPDSTLSYWQFFNQESKLDTVLVED